MKILGLDLGSKTLGMAISDMTMTIATPIGTINFPEKDLNFALDAVSKVIYDHQVKRIVLGLPKHMGGDLGTLGEYCLQFKEMLTERFSLEVIMLDERLTSRIVERVMISADMSRKKRKKNVDKLAATIILQNYLDSHPK